MVTKIRGKNVRVFGKNPKAALASPIFIRWRDALDPGISVRSINFQSVDRCGQGKTGKVLFIKMIVKAVDSRGRKIPGIVLLRGPSVAVLVVVHDHLGTWAVLTEQARLPLGARKFLEIPAGVANAGGDIKSNALREVAEELGVEIKESDLVDLTASVIGKEEGFHLSPGLLDEPIKIFLYETNLEGKDTASVRFGERETGLASEAEHIVLRVVYINNVTTSDAKTQLALALYRQYQATHAYGAKLKQ